MRSQPQAARLPAGGERQEGIQPSPDAEGDEAVHGQMRVTDGEVGEMPYRLQRAEGLEGALSRAHEVADHPYEAETQRIGVQHLTGPAANREQEVGAPTPHGHEHRTENTIAVVCSHQGSGLKRK